ncbi:MAG: hypothetical protein IJF65_07275 [Clostridia bacterium]|nr:hypothetical protein [Clostridia bacterium]
MGTRGIFLFGQNILKTMKPCNHCGYRVFSWWTIQDLKLAQAVFSPALGNFSFSVYPLHNQNPFVGCYPVRRKIYSLRENRRENFVYLRRGIQAAFESVHTRLGSRL